MSESEDSDRNFDENDPPTSEKALASAEEYLKFVRYQAASFPDVMYCPKMSVNSVCNNKSESEVFPTEYSDHETQKTSKFNSTKILQENQIIHFHKAVNEYQCLKSLVLQNIHESTKTSARISKETVLKQSPSLIWIAQRSRSEIIELFDIVSSISTKKHWNSKMNVWIFSLLVALEPPLHPDLYHALRTLVKKCRKLKKNFENSLSSTSMNDSAEKLNISEDVKFFNLYINLVCHVFGQSDLVDEIID
ncbi:unnamed protein product [Trichobilharzia szidati]|nr:unnamed protein product [Trichobilharzia szidati]